MFKISCCSALTGISFLFPLHLVFPCFCWILDNVWGSESLALLRHGVISFISSFPQPGWELNLQSLQEATWITMTHLWADEACPVHHAPQGRRKSLLGNEFLCEDHHEVTEGVKWKTWKKLSERGKSSSGSGLVSSVRWRRSRGDPAHFLRRRFPWGFF